MCGRYSLHSSPDVIALMFGLSAIPAYQPRYNIAPAAQALIIKQNGAAMVRWGLVPRWAKDVKGIPSTGAGMNNARAETVAQKPSFREAYRKRRCLIPANGFYEWKLENGVKQPYYVHPAGAELFAFAGLWEQWMDLQTCAIVTIDANEKMAAVHDRMPVILDRKDYSRWLAGEEGLLHPCAPDAIDIRRVSRAVNNARNDLPELIEPEDS